MLDAFKITILVVLSIAFLVPAALCAQKRAPEIEKLKQDNVLLRQLLTSSIEDARKEKALLYQELGAAYTQAKLFDLAIDAYKKSLTFNPDAADVHYRLGLLYRHSRKDPDTALAHFKKYLELKPQAADKKEIEYLIEIMSKKPFP